MKTIYLFLVTLLLGQSIQAQQWQCIQPGTKTYFTNATGYLRGIRIDSVRASGTATVLYPFHTPRGVYTGFNLLDSNGGSWLGRQIIATGAGATYFLNAYNDTFKINTQAPLGSSWTCYDDTTSVRYLATITATDTVTVDNTLDSFKAISFLALSGATAIPDSISRYTILLSKNHGLLRVFDLYNFPYHKPGGAQQRGLDYFDDVAANRVSMPGTAYRLFNRVRLQQPRNEDLERYEAGDVYQYSEYYLGLTQGTRTLRVDSKQDLGASIQYLVNETVVKQINTSGPTQYNTTRGTITRNITKGLALLIDTVKMPEESGSSFIYYYLPEDTSYCGPGAVYKINDNYIYGYRVNTFEPCGTSITYKTGRGRVYYARCWDPNPTGYESEALSYTKTGSGTCGAYDALAIPSLLPPGGKPVFYPNPANTTFTVAAPTPGPATIQVFDRTGRNILTVAGKDAGTQIDCTAWPGGLYLVRYLGNGEGTSAMLTIIH